MRKLRGFGLADYQHEGDKGTLLDLKKVAVLEKAVDWVVSNAIEKVAEVQQTGNSLFISEAATPELCSLVKEVVDVIDVAQVPQIYSSWRYDIYTQTDGDKNPKISISSGAIDLLDKNEMRFLLGHELGHFKSGHLKYLLLCRYWTILSKYLTGTNLLRIPLMIWSRNADYTADRLGLLACQDINVALRTMIKMAGAPMSSYSELNVPAFIKQAEEFELHKIDFGDKIAEKICNMDNAIPWMVKRAAELLTWYNSGKYEELLMRYGM